MDSWTPIAGQALVLKREPTNSHDVHAVAVYYDNYVVGHIPYNIAPKVSAFLRRDVNKGFAEVTGDKVNRGALGMDWRSHVPTVCMDLRPTLIK